MNIKSYNQNIRPACPKCGNTEDLMIRGVSYYPSDHEASIMVMCTAEKDPIAWNIRVCVPGGTIGPREATARIDVIKEIKK